MLISDYLIVITTYLLYCFQFNILNICKSVFQQKLSILHIYYALIQHKRRNKIQLKQYLK